MRRKFERETGEQRSDRLDQEAHDRNERISVEDDALDAAVRKSISRHGA